VERGKSQPTRSVTDLVSGRGGLALISLGNVPPAMVVLIGDLAVLPDVDLCGPVLHCANGTPMAPPNPGKQTSP
jgi:hypothetical protein